MDKQCSFFHDHAAAFSKRSLITHRYSAACTQPLPVLVGAGECKVLLELPPCLAEGSLMRVAQMLHHGSVTRGASSSPLPIVLQYCLSSRSYTAPWSRSFQNLQLFIMF